MAALRAPDTALTDAQCRAIAACIQRLCEQVAKLSQPDLLDRRGEVQE